MNLVNLTINNKSVSVPKGSTILDAAKKLNIKNINVCKIKNDLNDLEIFLNEKELIIKSDKKVNFKDLELNDFICSYKKTFHDFSLLFYSVKCIKSFSFLRSVP